MSGKIPPHQHGYELAMNTLIYPWPMHAGSDSPPVYHTYMVMVTHGVTGSQACALLAVQCASGVAVG